MKSRFIGIQIDGLSYYRLKDAVRKGHCPNLARIMVEFPPQRYNCGLPSLTPYAQAGIMYGHNENIAGFRWTDKKKRKEFSISNPFHAHLVEATYLDKGRGILQGGGKSYENLFSGGATSTHLTASMLTVKGVGGIVHQMDMLLFFLSPTVAWNIFKRSSQMAVSLVDYAYERLTAAFRRLAGASSFKAVVTRYFSSVVLSELVTKGLLKDMGKKVPFLYATYNAYDENSHHKGPSSPEAYDALKDIDAQVGRLWKGGKDDYDFYILSDHGHTESVPFAHLYGMDFQKFLRLKLSAYKHELPRTPLQVFAHRMGSFGRAAISPVVGLERAVHIVLSKTFRSSLKSLHWQAHPYFISASDCMINLYFNFSDEKVHLSQIDRRYPDLVRILVEHPGIGMIAGVDGEDVVVVGDSGSVRIRPDYSFTQEGKPFLKEYFSDDALLARQIADMARMRTSGDLILFSDFSKGDVVSFTNHFGSHGGAGGEQLCPFIMGPDLGDTTKTKDVRDLHQFFWRYHAVK
ncbi:MAG: alkaline phosphatase family protein [Nanoarchaeota archaeon]